MDKITVILIFFIFIGLALIGGGLWLILKPAPSTSDETIRQDGEKKVIAEPEPPKTIVVKPTPKPPKYGKWFCDNLLQRPLLRKERDSTPFKGYVFKDEETHKQARWDPHKAIPHCDGDAYFWPLFTLVDRKRNVYK